jgi:hypothetical protein
VLYGVIQWNIVFHCIHDWEVEILAFVECTLCSIVHCVPLFHCGVFQRCYTMEHCVHTLDTRLGGGDFGLFLQLLVLLQVEGRGGQIVVGSFEKRGV